MSLRVFKRYNVQDVFVPGGIPELTYNPRKDYDFETLLQRGKKKLCKLILVTGQTKSGKTVLVNRVYSKEQSIWIEGGLVSSIEDFWSLLAAKLRVQQSTSTSSETTGTTSIGGKASAGDGIISTMLGLRGEISSSASAAAKHGKNETRHVSLKNEVLQTLSREKTAIVVDDFHYIDKSTQGAITRIVKPLILEGIPVVFIAIPSHRYDVVKVESEMTGRIMRVRVPEWSIEELRFIAISGFDALNVLVDESVIDAFANEAIGSPHLMQEFCREICHTNQIDQTYISERNLRSFANNETIFERVSEGTGKHLYDKLCQGPNRRSPRIQRKLNSGGEVDIYQLCLISLARMRPGLNKITYDALRASIAEIVVREQMPQYGETSRVLEHMSKLSSNGNQRDVVIDWDMHDRILHITDPFFAFFLRWGRK